MSDKRKKSNKITIYLIKDEVKYDEILKDYAYKNVLREDDKSTTYYYPTRQHKPEWLISYFNETQDVEISNSHAKVISLHKLVIDGKEKVFAIPFGNGKSLLNDDVIEEQFGIKILLNSVSKDGFRQLSIANYGGDHRTKNEQTPKKTDISEFGFDIYSDFLRKATAKSEEELFNKNTITGGDLFSVSVPVTINDVNIFLLSCYERYKSNKYKENFSWLDNIKEVKEKKTKELLNLELVRNINEKNFDKVWTAVPEIIEWEDISDFRYKTSTHGFDDIEIQQVIELFKDGTIPNVDSLKNRKVYKLRRKLGIVFQDFKLLPKLTVYENVAFALEMLGLPNDEIRQKTLKALELVGLKNKVKNYPDQLSGGEQQRVAIARAIVNEPKLLLCDEPTGNLDPDTSWEVMKVLEEINNLGTTIIMATHDKEMVNRMKKRVILIEAGKLKEDYEKGTYNHEAA